MKTKKLALANGAIGLAGGIYLLLYLLFAGLIGLAPATLLATILKLVALILGIVSLVYYKGDQRVGAAGAVLFIVGGAVGIIPLLGWVGGILLIIGGSLYLACLKKFDTAQ